MELVVKHVVILVSLINIIHVVNKHRENPVPLSVVCPIKFNQHGLVCTNCTYRHIVDYITLHVTRRTLVCMIHYQDCDIDSSFKAIIVHLE